jgi:hypothetical protein
MCPRFHPPFERYRVLSAVPDRGQYTIHSTRTCSWEVKEIGLGADLTPESSAPVRNAESYTATADRFYMTYCLVRHVDSCISNG